MFNRTGANTEPWRTPVMTSCQRIIYYSIHQSLGSAIQTFFYPIKSKPVQAMSSQWSERNIKKHFASKIQISYHVSYCSLKETWELLLYILVANYDLLAQDITYLKIFVCISLHLKTEFCYLSTNYKKWQIPWKPLKTWISVCFFEELLLSFAAGQWQDRNSSVTLS